MSPRHAGSPLHSPFELEGLSTEVMGFGVLESHGRL
jgi:hypothetical protein